MKLIEEVVGLEEDGAEARHHTQETQKEGKEGKLAGGLVAEVGDDLGNTRKQGEHQVGALDVVPAVLGEKAVTREEDEGVGREADG